VPRVLFKGHYKKPDVNKRHSTFKMKTKYLISVTRGP